MTREKFLETLNDKYKKYNYVLISKNEVFHRHDKIQLNCPKHGIFTKNLSDFIYGKKFSRCKKCANEYLSKKFSKSNNFFKRQIFKKFGSDIELLEDYVNVKTKILIRNNITKKEYKIFPNNLLRYKYKTDNEKRKNEQEQFFIKKLREVHGEKYKIKKFCYLRNSPNRVVLLCKIHGEFEKRASSVLEGYGCRACSIDKAKRTLKEFVKISEDVHVNKYDYSKTKYINNLTKVCIICPKHGEFWQTPKQHIRGEGCPSCSESKGERKIFYYLHKKGIKHQRQKRFNDCINSETDSKLRFDFYLIDYNVLIEYDGEQHFKYNENKSKLFTKKVYEKARIMDKIKDDYCIKNMIKLYRIPYTKYNEVNEIIDSIINETELCENFMIF